jgi:hypothetical protein
MNKKIYLFTFLLLAAGGFLLFGWEAFTTPSPEPYQVPEKPGKAQRIKDAFEYDFERTKDLSLGYPPKERMIKALKETRIRQAAMMGNANRNTIAEARWKEVGPNNVGGRTRAMIIDARDPSRKTVWAGGVAGGLWKTDDITAPDPEWTIVSDFLENMAVGALAQDPNNPEVFYMGTGEGYSNGDAVLGRGIFKSTDGGVNWDVIPSTLNFFLTQDMLVHPNGDVYAARNVGLYRSQDGGQSWDKVLGTGLGAANFMYDIVLSPTGEIIVSNSNNVFRSSTGDPGDWENLTQGKVPATFSRVEVTVCESDPTIMYLIPSIGGAASNVYRSGDNGLTWQKKARPENFDGSEFTNGQAWYDLDIACDPFNPDHVIVGGVPLRETYTQGFDWVPLSVNGSNIHVDQHRILFDNQNEGTVYFGNDGGVYAVNNGVAKDHNLGYNVTQFYAVAMHPEKYSSYYLGGTQDNNSLQMTQWGLSNGRSVLGGDGAFCHIDQDDPNIQFVSSQFGNYAMSLNGGNNFFGAFGTDGRFISPSDYDDDANILYAESRSLEADLYRFDATTLMPQGVKVDILSENSSIRAITVDPNVPNRIYIGATNPSQVIRIDDAHEGTTLTGVSVGSFVGTPSSIDIEVGDEEHMIVTLSNYGLNDNIWEKKAGEPWVGVEGSGSLPDMPVYWAIFDPTNTQQAFIATEAGVWSTELLDGDNTVWNPPMPGRGTPLVRTDMLQTRPSDNFILAGTHGRGMFVTDILSDPVARFSVDEVHYVNYPLAFRGDFAINAQSFDWDLGDGTTTTEENFLHTYTNLGTYPIELTINGDNSLTASSQVKILPERPTPYQEGEADYSGSFEGFEEHYGVFTIEGSSFERGKSIQLGKSGVNSGENAFVVGLNDEYMEPSTHTILYLPNFDLSEPGIYEFSFFAKYDMETGLDGFRVEYSKDGGQNWSVLGANETENWYNTENTTLSDGAFPIGSRYFSKKVANFTEYKLNIGELAGEGNVAFRFVCRAGDNTLGRGLAIDDVSISRYDGALETTLTTFSAEFTQSTEITLTWTTQPEYFCQKFIIEQSENGKDFFEIEQVNPVGILTADPQSYSLETFGQRDLYFFRIKVINENVDEDYFLEFYSETIVLRRNIEGAGLFKVFPNPFYNYIDLTFTDVVKGDLQFDLYDEIGRQVFSGSTQLDGVSFYTIQLNPVPAGIYFLSVQIGEEDPEVVKLLGGF